MGVAAWNRPIARDPGEIAIHALPPMRRYAAEFGSSLAAISLRNGTPMRNRPIAHYLGGIGGDWSIYLATIFEPYARLKIAHFRAISAPPQRCRYSPELGEYLAAIRFRNGCRHVASRTTTRDLGGTLNAATSPHQRGRYSPEFGEFLAATSFRNGVAMWRRPISRDHGVIVGNWSIYLVPLFEP